MADWTTPKTDWYGTTVDGVYSGDKFNYTDFNRIRNNLIYLHDLAIELYPDFDINDVSTKTYTSYLYADDMNDLNDNLDIINSNTVNQDYGTVRTYTANGTTMTYDELNRLESAILDIYELLNNQYSGRRMLTFNLGITGDFT